MRTLLIVAVVAMFVILPLIAVAVSDPVPREKPAAVQVQKPPEGDLPFGLSSGAKLADLSIDLPMSKPDQGIYTLTNVPQPAEPFEKYSVTYVEGIGICTIRAMTAADRNDAIGTHTMATMERVAGALSGKYGKVDTLHDYCLGGAVCEGRFWDYALRGGSRTYGYEWRAPRAPKVRSIDFQAIGTDSGIFILLTYDVGNAQACAKGQAQMNAKGL